MTTDFEDRDVPPHLAPLWQALTLEFRINEAAMSPEDHGALAFRLAAVRAEIMNLDRIAKPTP